MRTLCTLAASLLLVACATQPQATTECSEPRSLVCTREFRPTCGVLKTGGTREFASPCTACADEAVTGYIPGPCPQ
ncbi:MAG: hypothetical protein KDI17_06455 [Halioglobus sp.]|nr:hypothetical protein [Halioglobus sp.]